MNRSFSIGLVIGLLIAGIFGYFIYEESPPADWHAAQRDLAPAEIPATVMSDSFIAAQQAGLLGNLLDLIDADLKDDPHRILAPETIDRIATFCYGARPYLAIDADSLGAGPYSPERGQLLLVLARMNLDSATWQAIKEKATFASAYLPEAELSGADLSHADLRSACLRDARLVRTTLSKSNLQFATLHGANLESSKADSAMLKHADLRWSTLIRADLRGANLDGAFIASANLDNAHLADASIQWADATGALLRRADLTRANISGIILNQAQLDSAMLDSASLVNARLLGTRLPGTSLVGADLERVLVLEADWYDLLKRWNVKGIDDLPSRYTMLDGKPKGKTGYRLDKAKQ